MNRECGGCTLCCKLLPMKASEERAARITNVIGKMVEVGLAEAADVTGTMRDFDKPAGERCPYQRAHGCGVYARRPFGCRYWNCRWLVNDDTAELSRPDRSRYVIDVSPDFIILTEDDRRASLEVVQVWVDPKHREAWRDPKLLAYLERRGREGKAAIIRYSSREAIIVFPPCMSKTGDWYEHRTGIRESEHSWEEKVAAIGTAARNVKIG